MPVFIPVMFTISFNHIRKPTIAHRIQNLILYKLIKPFDKSLGNTFQCNSPSSFIERWKTRNLTAPCSCNPNYSKTTLNKLRRKLKQLPLPHHISVWNIIE